MEIGKAVILIKIEIFLGVLPLCLELLGRGQAKPPYPVILCCCCTLLDFSLALIGIGGLQLFRPNQ